MTSPSILLVTKGLDIGGIERVVVDLAIGLVVRGYRTDVAVVNDRRDALAGRLEEAGVPLHRLGGTDLVGAPAARRLAKLVRGDEFDVVHVHGPLPAVLVRALRPRRRLIVTAHTPWRGMRRTTRLGWLATAWADTATVAVSSAVAASMPAGSSSSMRVIPHGVDPVAVAAAFGEARGRRDETGPLVAVTIANHSDVKNYPNLLHGLKIAQDLGADVRLVAVGEGSGLAAHRTLAARLGLSESVDFQPPTPDVLGLIASGELLVVASDFEGQPLVVSEALALGRPVVATAVGRVPELVTRDVGLVVPPADPTALGTAIAALASDPALRVRLGSAARAAGLRWTLSDAIDAHIALYDGVTDAGGEAPVA